MVWPLRSIGDCRPGVRRSGSKAKKVGLVLKSLGLRTILLGRMGRGLELTSVMKRKIHELAARLGIDRRAISSLMGLESGYGSAPCALCEEFGTHRRAPLRVSEQISAAESSPL